MYIGILSTSHEAGKYYYTYFTDEETEACRRLGLVLSGSQSCGLNPGNLAPEPELTSLMASVLGYYQTWPRAHASVACLIITIALKGKCSSPHLEAEETPLGRGCEPTKTTLLVSDRAGSQTLST